MPTQVFDYIKEVNRLSDELLHSHSELLGRKNIRRKQQLIRAIKLDLDKLTHAMLEVKLNRASGVVQGFFSESRLDPAAICARLSGDGIYHVGFEIHEPMSLVLHGINHWIEHSRDALGADMRVRESLRFPASAAFQKRVGAYTEIMRIWLEVAGRVLMLELFDIHRPADSMLASAPRLTHRNFNGLFRYNEATADGHPERVERLFSNDEIWHYALYVKRPADVTDLHGELQTLAARDASYTLPYTAPVHNLHDDSYHTKIVRLPRLGQARLELEFVTKYDRGRVD